MPLIVRSCQRRGFLCMLEGSDESRKSGAESRVAQHRACPPASICPTLRPLRAGIGDGAQGGPRTTIRVKQERTMSKSRKLRCLAAFVLTFALAQPMAWAASPRSEEGFGSALGWLASLWRGVLGKAACTFEPDHGCGIDPWGQPQTIDHGCVIDPWGQLTCGSEPMLKHGCSIDPWGRPLCP